MAEFHHNFTILSNMKHYILSNALCDIIYYALLEDNSEVRREQGVSGESSSCPGDVFHPDFHHGHLLILIFL